MSDILDTTPDTLKPKPPIRALVQEADALSRESNEMGQRAQAGMADLAKQREAEMARRKVEREQDLGAYNTANADIQKALTERPHTEMPSPDLGPPLDPQSTQSLAFGMIALSLVGMARGKAHWGEATAALDGMLQGFKAGAETNIKEAKAKFDREVKIAMQRQKEALDAYEDTLKSKTLSLNQVAEMMKVHAAANQDWEMQQAAATKNFDAMYRRMDQLRTSSDRIQSQVATLQDRMEAREQHRQDMEAAREEKRNPTMTDETLRLKAEQYLSGDTTVKQNIGRGVQGSANLAALENMISTVAKERGMNGKDIAAAVAEFQGIKSGERTLGTRTANIEMAATEARSLAELALDASEKVARTGVKTINDAEQAVQKHTASPELRAFVASNTSLINAYARAINPQGVGTVADKEHARDMLDTAFSKGDYRATVEQLLKEIDAARKSPGQVRESMHEGFAGAASGPKPGTVEQGYRFKGGDPSKQENWERL